MIYMMNMRENSEKPIHAPMDKGNFFFVLGIFYPFRGWGILRGADSFSWRKYYPLPIIFAENSEVSFQNGTTAPAEGTARKLRFRGREMPILSLTYFINKRPVLCCCEQNKQYICISKC